TSVQTPRSRAQSKMPGLWSAAPWASSARTGPAARATRTSKERMNNTTGQPRCMATSPSRRNADPGFPIAAPGSEGRFAIDEDAHDQAEEGHAFEQGGDDQHGGLDAGGDLGLAGHALQGGRANAAEAEAGADDRQGSPKACADGAAGEGDGVRRRLGQ